MEGLPQKDLNPFELEDEDDILPSGVPITYTATSPRKAPKRPRSPTTDTGRDSAQPSGQWAMNINGSSDDPDKVSLSMTDPRATAQGEPTSPSLLAQVRQGLGVFFLLLCRVSLILATSSSVCFVYLILFLLCFYFLTAVPFFYLTLTRYSP